jgi:hypothetical protein
LSSASQAVIKRPNRAVADPPMFKDPPMSPEQMRAALRRSLKLNVLLALLGCALAATVLLLVLLRPSPQVVAMSPDGRLVSLVTLEQPFVNSRTLAKHAADMIAECLTFNSADFVRVMQDKCRNFFQPDAFVDFRGQLEQSKFMRETLTERYATFVRVEAPIVVEQKTVGGIYTWVLETPVRVTQQAGRQERYLNWTAVVTVQRASNIDVPTGIWTTNLLLEPRSTGG